MQKVQLWWNNPLSKWVKFVFLVLLANGLPAFIILMSLPDFTDILFVWTIKPPVSARLLGVMYSNAILLVGFGAIQTSWANTRITMVVITLFSVMATLLTFVYIDPFLAHPWYHLAYWLIMYLVLFFAAPYVFYTHEKQYGGKLPVNVPLNLPAKIVLVASAIISVVLGVAFLFYIDVVNDYWPWQIAPLVGGLIGILYITHTVAYLWGLWDGDWLRIRPIIWQAPITNMLFILITLIHQSDLEDGMEDRLLTVRAVALLFIIMHTAIIVMYRNSEISEN